MHNEGEGASEGRAKIQEGKVDAPMHEVMGRRRTSKEREGDGRGGYA